MPDEILPGTYIQVRAEALITTGPISAGNIGIVGTASQGPIGEVQILSSYADAKTIYGSYDAFNSPNPLTLVRALELAYSNGASTVFAVRVASTAGPNAAAKAAPTAADLGAANVTIFRLEARETGTSGNDIAITIADLPTPSTLSRVTIKRGPVEEVYDVANGNELAAQVNAGSALVRALTAPPLANAGNKPAPINNVSFKGGANGAAAADTDYAAGFEALLNEDVQIVVAAGQNDDVIGNEMLAHVTDASDDNTKRDRIAVLGTRGFKDAGHPNETLTAFLTDITNPTTTGDRIILVTPGIKVTDAAATPPKEVTLPGAFAAAAVAGMMSARSPHISLTNKTISAAGLEVKFSPGQLEQLVKAQVLALEERRGFRVVKAVTTDAAAFPQITTRRIVDYAKAGVRSGADPYIGQLNNARVRQALKGTLNGFLSTMVDDEMLVADEGYKLEVTATRPEEVAGIAKVTMTLRPTFSLDKIKVVMFLG
jgi:hypothetical protein